MYAEKLLPHDIEAEEAVIGSLLIDPDCIVRVAPILEPRDFYRERNRLCYAAAMALYRRDQAIDQLLLAGELARTDTLEPAGGMAYLSHLVSITPTSVHAEDYAAVVKRTSTMRRLIDAAAKISAIGYGDAGDVEAALREAEAHLYEVRGDSTARGWISNREMYDRYLQERSEFLDPASDTIPIMTGYPDVDELLGGLRGGEMVVLGARPSFGKTALALNIVNSAARSGMVCGFFSIEMSLAQLAPRNLAAMAGVDLYRVRNDLVTHFEESQLMDAVGVLSEYPVYWDDTPYQTAVEMRGKARQLARDQGLNLLVVDYLQLVQGQGRSVSANREREISEVSRALKGLARELDVALIACSQLNRMAESRPSHRPQLSDLRDSGSIEQDADVVMFIHREDMYTTEEEWLWDRPAEPYPKNVADIIVAKNRNGPTGAVQLEFRDSLVRFDSMR